MGTPSCTILNNHSTLTTRTPEEICRITTREKEPNLQKKEKISDFIFPTRTLELLKSLTINTKTPDLIFPLKWNKSEEKKTLDTMILKTSLKVTEELQLRLLILTLKVSLCLNP